MSHRDLALVQGLDHTRATLRRWNGAPWRVVGVWALGSLAVSAALLYLVWPRETGGIHRALWITVAPIAILSMLYQNDGWVQFGQRFALADVDYAEAAEIATHNVAVTTATTDRICSMEILGIIASWIAA